MDLLTPIVPVIVSYLDTECRSVLLVVSKQMRQIHWEFLDDQLPKEVGQFIRACIRLLQSSGQGSEESAQPILLVPRNQLFSVVLGIYHWSPAELVDQLHYLSSSVFSKTMLCRRQYQLRHYFKIAPENLDRLPEIHLAIGFNDRDVVTITRNGGYSLRLEGGLDARIDKMASTTEIRFHLRKLTVHCPNYNSRSTDQCQCDLDSNNLCNILGNIGEFQHSRIMINGYRHFSKVALDLIQPHDVNKTLYLPFQSDLFEPHSVDKIIVVIGEEIEYNAILTLRRVIVDKFSYSGKARVDVYVLAESLATAEAFYASGNHTWSTVQHDDIVDASRCYDTETISKQTTVLKQFQQVLEKQASVSPATSTEVDWFEFTYRAPETLPYRTRRPRPTFRFANDEVGLWLRDYYSIVLENPDVLQSDGNISVASLQLKVDDHPAFKSWQPRFEIYSKTVFYTESLMSTSENWLNHMIRLFESFFWLLTGNHWHDYPHRFKAIPGLYRPPVGDDNILQIGHLIEHARQQYRLRLASRCLPAIFGRSNT